MNTAKFPHAPLGTRLAPSKGPKMKTDAQFWSKLARKYAADPIKDVESYEAGLARTLEFFDADARLLEIGCGTGMTALKLAKGVGHVTSTDIADGMIEIANERLAQDGATNVTFKVAPADQRIDGAPFDGVCAYNILHLVPDLNRTLGVVRDQLEPGGIFVSKSVCLKGKGWFLKPLIRVMQMVGKAPYVSFLSESELKDKIAAHGFEVLEDKVMGKRGMSYFVVARKL